MTRKCCPSLAREIGAEGMDVDKVSAGEGCGRGPTMSNVRDEQDGTRRDESETWSRRMTKGKAGQGRAGQGRKDKARQGK